MSKPKPPATFSIWQRLNGSALGRWLFVRLIAFKAPYFGSISARVLQLGPNQCVASIAHTRRVQNHIGTVHAIAMCNLAELCAGLMADVSVPYGMRWIPKGMQVQYLKKAVGKLTATGTPLQAFVVAAQGYSVVVQVVLCNSVGEAVFQANIDLWVSPVR